MQLTAQEIHQSAIMAPVECGGLANRLSTVILALMARRQTGHVVQGLSDAQLRDAGIDRAAVLGNRRMIDADARLTTYLASLR
ncbi:hypothetical protein ACO2I3_19100 [Leptospira interrogans]